MDINPIDYTPYVNELQRYYIPKLVLTLFSDGYSWTDFKKIYAYMKNISNKDIRLKRFSVSETDYNAKNNLDLKYYSFEYDDSKIILEENVTENSGRQIYIHFSSEYKMKRAIFLLKKVFSIEKNDGGYYTFPGRLVDMITPIKDKNTIVYMSVL